MTRVPHGPGGSVLRACAFDARDTFGRLTALQTATRALMADVGPYLSGEPAVFEFEQDIPRHLGKLHSLARWDPVSPAVREISESIERLGSHARLIVVVVAVVDGYGEARAEVDAL